MNILLGERKVQGLDYAYTIHGWMKVLNRSMIDYTSVSNADMGYDGINQTTAANRYVGRDVLGYALNYFDADYVQICATCRKSEVAMNTTGTGLGTGSPSLYNGNIRNMVTHLTAFGAPHGYAYRYDQLNRLKSMQRWTSAATNTAWPNTGVPTGNYNERIQYDPNGNILSYLRNGNLTAVADTLMDNLAYTYTAGTNRLAQVVDAQSVATKYSTDIDGTTNYTYDNTGNLITSTNALTPNDNVTDILWNAYGKVERITKANGQVVVFGYDGMQNRIMKAVRTGVDTVFTFYVRDAQGNVLGVYNRTTAATPTITWAEQYIYGSGRVGSINPGLAWTAASAYSGPHYSTTRRLLQGQKRYELSNHLGNVLVTINDRRVPRDGAVTDNVAEFYDALVLSANDYYPFGMEMPGRTFAVSSGYRYGFNGKEKDPSEFGSLTHYDYGFRIYNPAIGKFLSVDPLRGEYPWYTPYQFAGNMPILCVDIDGKEGVVGFFWGMVGEAGGQLLTNGFKPSEINWYQVGFAGAQGFISPAANTTRTVKIVSKLASYGLEYAKAASDPKNQTIGDVIREGTQNIIGAEVGDKLFSKAAKKLDDIGGVDAVKKATKEAKKTENIAEAGRPRIAQTNRAKVAARTLSNAKTAEKTKQNLEDMHDLNPLNGAAETGKNLIQSGTNGILSIISDPEDDPSTANLPIEAAPLPKTIIHYSNTLKRMIEARYDPSIKKYIHRTSEETKSNTDEKRK